MRAIEQNRVIDKNRIAPNQSQVELLKFRAAFKSLFADNLAQPLVSLSAVLQRK